MDILKEPSFWLIALGTMLLSLSSAMIGCLNVYKGQSLIGDAVGHSSLPGVILVFMLFQTREPVYLLLGAMLSGAFAYYLVQMSVKQSKIGLDAALAIFLSGFFGLGLVLKSFIEGNPNFKQATQAGLDNYIFGQASYMLSRDIVLIAVVSFVCISLLVLFYKELKLYIFDPVYLQTIGLSTKLISWVLLFLTIALISVGLKSVGAILISSLLIIPSISANQWSKRFSIVLILSAVFGIISAFLGTFISTAEKGFSTGPTIIVVNSILAVFSMLFGAKSGFITSCIKRKRGAKNV